MESRIYYGEYSLAYWIEMMLTKKIELPKYQRYFVWNEKQLMRLLDSLKENRFVPPVTIGSFQSKDGEKVNYIIDGQQRLTCILLAYLGIFPSKEGFKEHLRALAEGDTEGYEEGEDPFDNVLRWNFGLLTEKGSEKTEILEKCESSNYNHLNLEGFNIDASFFKNSFMGFSYIVPERKSIREQQAYYTKVFRDINMQGTKLQELESRRAMYFINDQYQDLFEPSFAENYYVQLVAGPRQQMDFVRYLSLMAAYYHTDNVNKVARGYSYRIEKYFEEYIYSVIGDGIEDDYTTIFGEFTDVFPDGIFSDDMLRLTNTLSELKIPNRYPSIINMDIYFFGIVYFTLFLHRQIDMDSKEELQKALERGINEMREMGHQIHTPAQLQYLRARITKSVEIYQNYLLP